MFFTPFLEAISWAINAVKNIRNWQTIKGFLTTKTTQTFTLKLKNLKSNEGLAVRASPPRSWREVGDSLIRRRLDEAW